MEQEILDKDPMRSVSMIKKKNFYEEEIPTCDTISVFTDEEVIKLNDECFKTWDTGKRVYQQSAAYILMLNTGLRTGELLGLLNSDIDLENRVLHINQAVKEVQKRDGVEFESGREIEVGKPKTATSKRTVPLNNTAVEAIKELRAEFYFGEDTHLWSATVRATTRNRATLERGITEYLKRQVLNRRDYIASDTHSLPNL